jgi:hypothetical protein
MLMKAAPIATTTSITSMEATLSGGMSGVLEVATGYLPRHVYLANQQPSAMREAQTDMWRQSSGEFGLKSISPAPANAWMTPHAYRHLAQGWRLLTHQRQVQQQQLEQVLHNTLLQQQVNGHAEELQQRRLQQQQLDFERQQLHGHQFQQQQVQCELQLRQRQQQRQLEIGVEKLRAQRLSQKQARPDLQKLERAADTTSVHMPAVPQTPVLDLPLADFSPVIAAMPGLNPNAIVQQKLERTRKKNREYARRSRSRKAANASVQRTGTGYAQKISSLLRLNSALSLHLETCRPSKSSTMSNMHYQPS